MKKIMIAGISSGCGKTTICCGILKALVNRNLNVTSFKCGPDYIDPMFHSHIIGTKARNLDGFLLEKDMLQQLFLKHAKDCDVTVIEGAMGYYDGVAMTDQASSHEIAAITGTPVILVVSGKGMSRSMLAMLTGYFGFEEHSMIQGVIFNHIPESMMPELTAFCEQKGVKVLGNFPDIPEASIESRHLGLVTADEIVHLKEKVECLAQEAETQLNLDLLLEIAQTPEETQSHIACCRQHTTRFSENNAGCDSDASASFSWKENRRKEIESKNVGKKLRIAVAKDLAFCFYYEDNFDCLREAGCEIVEFSPMADLKLPENIDGLYLGGGYPEIFAKQLEENVSMRESIKEQIVQGLVTFAECGGFLYLHTELTTQEGITYRMCGSLPGSCFFTEKLQHFGYSVMTAKEDNLFCGKGEKIRVHEFHRFVSELEQTVFESEKQGRTWGSFVRKKNLLAGFPHVHFYSHPQLVTNFLHHCEQYQGERLCIQHLQS